MQILFLPSKNKTKQKITHTYFRTHVAVYEKAKVHVTPHRIIGPESFLLSVVPLRKAWHLLGHLRTLRAFKQSSQCLSFRRPSYPTLTFHVNTWSLLSTSSQDKGGCCCKEHKTFPPFSFETSFSHNSNPFCKWLRRAFGPNVLPWHLCSNSRKWKRRLDVITGCRAAKPLQGLGIHMLHLRIWIPFSCKGFWKNLTFQCMALPLHLQSFLMTTCEIYPMCMLLTVAFTVAGNSHMCVSCANLT